MIQVNHVVKMFQGQTALNGAEFTIEDGTICGLIGPNGSGKSTLLRLISGVYKADMGNITVDGEDVYENVRVKDRIFFLSDELYFRPQATLDSMAKFYAGYYSRFSYDTYDKMCRLLPLDRSKRIAQFSKGMQRQAGLILAISSCPHILLLDEAFDGLDPVVRHLIRRILVQSVAKYNITVVISSHNLRELEDLCDHIGLIHKGGVLLDKDIDSLKLNLSKYHCAFRHAPDYRDLKLTFLRFERQGNIITFTARGTRQEIEEYLEQFDPVFMEAIPLTLEEVFLQEMEVAGYDYSKIDI